MRDAFGGTFMIQIFLVFILIYIGFTAVALNYAKAFKVKNAVIDYLENSEISSLDGMTASDIDQMKEYFDKEILGRMNYNLSGQNICNSNGIKEYDDAGTHRIALCDDLGIIIQQSNVSETGSTIEGNTEGVYYTVSTFVGWSIPFLNKLLALNGNNEQQETIMGVWKISGQTRLIVNE